jgi:hypothetical protein
MKNTGLEVSVQSDDLPLLADEKKLGLKVPSVVWSDDLTLLADELKMLVWSDDLPLLI